MSVDLIPLADAARTIAQAHHLPAVAVEEWALSGACLNQAAALQLLQGLSEVDGWLLLQRDRPLAMRFSRGAVAHGEIRAGDRIIGAQLAVSRDWSLEMQQDGAESVNCWWTGLASAAVPAALLALDAGTCEVCSVLVSEARHASTLPGMAIRSAVAWRVQADAPVPDEAASSVSPPAETQAAGKGKGKDKNPPKPPVPQPALLAGMCEPWAARMLGFVAMERGDR